MIDNTIAPTEEPKYKKTYGLTLRYRNALKSEDWRIHSYTVDAYTEKEARLSLQHPKLDYSSIDLQLITCIGLSDVTS